jgi:uncharacterized membrane protein YphA (DoxX/SURF4 family)
MKAAYWIFTVLCALPMLASGIGFSISVPFAIQGMAHLGYPLYIIRFLGVAKILGAVAILTGLSRRLKEWAYAGFVFDLIGAAYSHFQSGEGAKAPGPLIILAFTLFSYFYWKRLAGRNVCCSSVSEAVDNKNDNAAGTTPATRGI